MASEILTVNWVVVPSIVAPSMFGFVIAKLMDLCCGGPEAIENPFEVVKIAELAFHVALIVTAPGVPPANTDTVTKPDALVVPATNAVLPCVPKVTPPGLPVNVKSTGQFASAVPVLDSALNVKVACEVAPDPVK